MDTFNPYSEWLELDSATTQPNYYELFGLDPFEDDEKKITAAADRAMSKVRACRPGPQAARWAQVLDELDAVKDCLGDTSRKGKYDEQLRNSGTYGQTQANTSTGAAPIPSSTESINPMFPPGMAGNPTESAPPTEATSAQTEATPEPASQPLASALAPIQTPTAVPDQVAATGQYASLDAQSSPAGADQAPGETDQGGTGFVAIPGSTPQPTIPVSPATPANYNQPGFAGTVPTGGQPQQQPITPQAPLVQPTPANTMDPMATAPLDAVIPVTNPMDPMAAAPLAANPVAYATPQNPVPQTPATNPMDPMAPVQAPGMTTPVVAAAQNYATAPVNPMEPMSLDPMSPTQGKAQVSPIANPAVAGSSPFASNAVAATNAMSPIGQSESPAGPVATATPVGSSVTAGATPASEPVAVGKEKTAVKKATEHQRESKQKLVVACAGLGVALLFGSIAFFVIPKTDPVAQSGNNKDSRPTNDGGRIPPTTDDSTPTPEDVPPTTSDPTPRVTPKPEPVDDPPTIPTDDSPKPVPPMPAPMPDPPKPMPMLDPPSPKDVEALGEALKTARRALYEKELDVADTELAIAEPLAKLPAHKAKLKRLKTVAGLVRQYWKAVAEGTRMLDAADEIKISETSIVVVVEVLPDLLIIRVAGQNRRYELDKLPPGLAMKIAERALNPSDSTTGLIKGAIYAVETIENPDNDKAKEVRQNWTLAEAQGAEVGDLYDFLDDDYDLLKDLN